MLSHTASTSWIRSSTLRLKISSSWVGLMDKVYAGTGRDAICTHNAPHQVRRVNARRGGLSPPNPPTVGCSGWLGFVKWMVLHCERCTNDLAANKPIGQSIGYERRPGSPAQGAKRSGEPIRLGQVVGK